MPIQPSPPRHLVVSCLLASLTLINPFRASQTPAAAADRAPIAARAGTRVLAARVIGVVAVRGLPSVAVAARGFAPGEDVLAVAVMARGRALDSSLLHTSASGVLKGTLPVPLLGHAARFRLLLRGERSGAAVVLARSLPRAIAAPAAIWAALARLNYWRAAVGAMPLALDPRLQQDSMLDSAYLDRNMDNPACQRAGCGHFQVAGLPGYTGAWPWNRCAAVRYPWFCGDEVLASGAPRTAVDELVATVFHRVIMLDPSARFVGIGGAALYGHRFVPIDPGAGPATVNPPRWWAFPVPGQRDVPPVLTLEEPSPVPPGVQAPNGDPITIAFAHGGDDIVSLTLRRIRHGLVSAAIPAYVYPAANKIWRGTAWATPDRPLCPASTYRVQAVLRLGRALIRREWDFTTAAGQAALPCA